MIREWGIKIRLSNAAQMEYEYEELSPNGPIISVVRINLSRKVITSEYCTTGVGMIERRIDIAPKGNFEGKIIGN